LAQHAQLPPTLVAQRMMGYTDSRRLPSEEAYLALVAPAPTHDAGLNPDDPALGTLQSSGQPFPFFLAHALPPDAPADLSELLGPVSDWLAEWKFDGIRAQIVRHGEQTCVWSRGEDLITESFPDIVQASAEWPDGTILDGEIV